MQEPTKDTASPRPWRWGVWHAADDDWLAALEQRHAVMRDATTHGGGGDAAAMGTKATIPKRIHQIWLGPNEIPSRCASWMKTWQERHPDWEYKAFREASNYGEKSDILRYEILAQVGGVYVDIDMECLQPFDTLFQRFAFVVGISNTGCVEINNAVIAARPSHPILSRLIDAIYKRAHQPQLDAAMLARISLMGGADVAQHLTASTSTSASSASMSTIERTGPGLMTRTFMEAIGWTSTKNGSLSTRHEGFLSTADQEHAIALPTDVLYPLANDDAGDAAQHEPRAFPPQTLAVHYWARTWQTPVA